MMTDDKGFRATKSLRVCSISILSLTPSLFYVLSYILSAPLIYRISLSDITMDLGNEHENDLTDKEIHEKINSYAANGKIASHFFKLLTDIWVKLDKDDPRVQYKWPLSSTIVTDSSRDSLMALKDSARMKQHGKLKVVAISPVPINTIPPTAPSNITNGKYTVSYILIYVLTYLYHITYVLCLILIYIPPNTTLQTLMFC